jgi:signal transduction histidine kinase
LKLSKLFPFHMVHNLLLFVVEVFDLFRGYVARSIRFQLILTFIICTSFSFIIYAISSSFFGTVYQRTSIDYSNEMQQIDRVARDIAGQIEDYENNPPKEWSPGPIDSNSLPGAQSSSSAVPAVPDVPSTLPKKLVDIPLINRLEQDYYYNQYKIMIVDPNGKVIYKNKNAVVTEVDLFSLMRSAMEPRTDGMDSRKEFSSLYPMQYLNQKGYVVVSGIPQPTVTYEQGESPLSYIAALVAFILLFYYLTKRKMKYIEELAGGLKQISLGNLDYRVEERSRDELGSLAANMNQMAIELQSTLEEERRAERTKNELITNVSHDLRTPLTLIMGYLRLLQDKGYESEQQADSYVQIAYQKSEKLQSLIEDLFEYTKLTNQGIPLYKERVCINELLEQLTEELVTMTEESGLQLRKSMPSERLMLDLDPGKMIRVFENLLTNAIRYSYKPGEIKLTVTRENGYVNVCLANRGPALTADELPRLFERFYRVDSSRSSVTGGSGLGLAIAKNIVDAHDGVIWAEYIENEIRFWVKLKLA